LSSAASNIDLSQLELIYKQASRNIDSLQKTFEDLVIYHNQMVNERISYISKELPGLEEKIRKKSSDLKNLLKRERELAELVSKSDSFEELENLISELNSKYRDKGEYESIISQ